jgi:hypothetical protein
MVFCAAMPDDVADAAVAEVAEAEAEVSEVIFARMLPGTVEILIPVLFLQLES